VTAALQLIRHDTLTAVGVYDEGFRMGLEDVDYCLRVFEAGLECIYEPSVRAYHLEKYFRSKPSEKVRRWTVESTHRMRVLWGRKDLSRWVPEVL
jgi:GT2 family glycosyltransferase